MLVFTNNVFSFNINNETVCNMINMYLTSYIYRNALDFIINKLILSIQKNMQIPVLNAEQEKQLIIYILNLKFTNIYTFNNLCYHLQLIINKITELVYGINYNVFLKINQKPINNFNILIDFPMPIVSTISFPKFVKTPIILPYASEQLNDIVNIDTIEEKNICSIFSKMIANDYNLLIRWISNRLIYVINNDNILTNTITNNLYNEIRELIPTIIYTDFDLILRKNNFDSINHMIEIYIKLTETETNEIDKNKIII